MLLLLLLRPALALDPVVEYASLLAISVKEDGIGYAALAEGRAALDAYVEWLGAAEPGATEADRAAFWINAFNAIVLRQVLDSTPKPASLTEQFFDGRTWRVAGRDVTLAGIEAILKELREPLAVFALHRASRSSPPLAAVLYRGSDLADALAQQARSYLADKEQNRFAYAQLEAELSMLLLWHREDLEEGRKGDVPPLQLFLADHVEKEEIARPLRTAVWRISFRPYDWSLDEAGGGSRGTHPVWLVLYAIAAGALLALGFRAFRRLLGPPAPGAP